MRKKTNQGLTERIREIKENVMIAMSLMKKMKRMKMKNLNLKRRKEIILMMTGLVMTGLVMTGLVMTGLVMTGLVMTGLMMTGLTMTSLMNLRIKRITALKMILVARTLRKSIKKAMTLMRTMIDVREPKRRIKKAKQTKEERNPQIIPTK